MNGHSSCISHRPRTAAARFVGEELDQRLLGSALAWNDRATSTPRGSTTALEHEVESLTRGAPIEARADPSREMEAAGDGEPAAEAVLGTVEEPPGAGSLSRADVRRRSDLAVHLRPSIFPATRADIVECAREESAPDDLLEALASLDPVRSFHTAEEIWEALGGERRGTRASRGRNRRGRTAARRVAVGAPRARVPVRPPAPAARAALRRDTGARPRRDRSWSGHVCRPLRALASGDAAVEHRGRLRATGGYFPLKTVGPAHLSISDRGLTFATNDAEGVCIAFHEPVPGIDPRGIVRHPALTVTVDDPQRLVTLLRD